MSEAMSVIIPTFPKDEESELACAVSVIFHSPGVSRPEQFKGEHKTWRAAYAALFQKLTTQFREGKDERALENLITMRDNQAATPEKYKQAYQQRKAEGIDVDIFTLDWPSTIVNVDPALAKKHGLAQGMFSCCWNCGATDKPLKKCARCKKAQYCSPACQKAAWWHHKRTENEDHKCVC